MLTLSPLFVTLTLLPILWMRLARLAVSVRSWSAPPISRRRAIAAIARHRTPRRISRRRAPLPRRRSARPDRPRRAPCPAWRRAAARRPRPGQRRARGSGCCSGRRRFNARSGTGSLRSRSSCGRRGRGNQGVVPLRRELLALQRQSCSASGAGGGHALLLERHLRHAGALTARWLEKDAQRGDFAKVSEQRFQLHVTRPPRQPAHEHYGAGGFVRYRQRKRSRGSGSVACEVGGGGVGSCETSEKRGSKVLGTHPP